MISLNLVRTVFAQVICDANLIDNLGIFHKKSYLNRVPSLMPSQVAGYAYDMFISYRQNDNRNGWVTDFVNALQDELAAIIKDPVSIYFDKDPDNGLRETHDVNNSLDEKLRSFIFIPVLSQTYCDPRGYAFANEFVPFHKLASEDGLGLKIKSGGNVTSRVLPVTIHQLESKDVSTIESYLGSPIRGIDFIYSTQGVSRPLRQREQQPRANANHTFYQDQVHKVARAVKELIDGGLNKVVERPANSIITVSWTSKLKRIKIAVVVATLIVASVGLYFMLLKQNRSLERKSIAVLPFENMNKDESQDYFVDGITEDILTHLTRVEDIDIKSRTSTLQYKNTTKAITIIGDELGVGHILEGSVRKVGDRVRVTVQLIDAVKDVHVWSANYDRDLKDILALQSEIALAVVAELQSRLSAAATNSINKKSSENITAYDTYLKGRAIFLDQVANRDALQSVLEYMDKAIALDSLFAEAYAMKAQVWYSLSGFGIPQNVWEDSTMKLSSKAIELDPSSADGYIVKAQVLQFLGKMDESRELTRLGHAAAPGNLDMLEMYGYQLLRDQDPEGAELALKAIENKYSRTEQGYYYSWALILYEIDKETGAKMFQKAYSLDTTTKDILYRVAQVRREQGRYREAISWAETSIKGSEMSADDFVAWNYYMLNDYRRAEERWKQFGKAENDLEDTAMIYPYRHRLAMVYLKTGRKAEADKLMADQFERNSRMLKGEIGIGVWDMKGYVFYDQACLLAYYKKNEQAIQNLDSAFSKNFNWDWGFHHDPLLDPLRNAPAFQKLLQKIDAVAEFRKRAYLAAIRKIKLNKRLLEVIGPEFEKIATTERIDYKR